MELKGQFQNSKSEKLATISCEAIVDHGLYCWNWFAGRVGANSDLTVLKNPPYFISLFEGNCTLKLPEDSVVNGIHRDWFLYFLTDGIYGDWVIFRNRFTARLMTKK